MPATTSFIVTIRPCEVNVAAAAVRIKAESADQAVAKAERWQDTRANNHIARLIGSGYVYRKGLRFTAEAE